MTSAGVSVPGKLMISGEYAVLFGAPAIATAIDRRVIADWAPNEAAGSQPLRPEAKEARRFAEEICGPVKLALHIDVDSLYEGGQKLGLGSSAASAVAAAAAVFAKHGHDVLTLAVREQIFACAFKGHKAIAPHGSGADVAASAYGGFIHFETRADNPMVIPLEPPTQVHWSVVFTQHSARTSDLVYKVNALRSNQASLFETTMSSLKSSATDFLNVWRSTNPASLITAVEICHEAMRSLGETANAPIVEERLNTIATLAKKCGGAAKPSGAGGGDVALSAFDSASCARQFESECKRAGFIPLNLKLGSPGPSAL